MRWFPCWACVEGVEHESTPTKGGFRAGRVRKGHQTRKPPTLRWFPCWACVEGVEHESTPTKGGFCARCVRKGTEHENHPNMGDFHARCVRKGCGGGFCVALPFRIEMAMTRQERTMGGPRHVLPVNYRSIISELKKEKKAGIRLRPHS